MGVWVGRYAISHGEVQEHGPWLVDRQRRREDESLRLLVLAEPLDERSAEFCTEVAEAVAALFARESLSITGGLQRALQQAHTNLAEWNHRSLREHRVAVGVTCVVLREGEATIVQAGPGVVYAATAQGVTRLSTEGEPAAIPLGAAEAIAPRFTSTTVPGRTLLLLTSGVERAIGADDVEAALAVGPERALAELFRRTHGMRDMTAVLVADLDIDDSASPPPAPLDVDESIAGREVVMPAVDSGWDRGRHERAPAARARGERLSGPRGGGARAPEVGQPVPFPAIRRPARVVGRRYEDTPLPWRWIGLGVATLVAVAALAWTFGPGLLRDDRQAELDRAVATTQTQLGAAESAQRAADQRLALQAVLAATERARALAPGEPRVQEIEVRARARLALLDAVTDLPALTPVLKFDGALTAPVTPLALVGGGSALWMIESGRGRVFRIDAAGRTPPLEVFRAGTTYGGAVARDPVSIAWDATASRLLLLDAARNLFAIADDAQRTPKPLPLRGAGDMRSAVAIAAYLGNLYVLDPAGGAVWRYLPASEGFDSERAGVLGGAEIGTTTGLAVDGDVFLLDQTRLRRFRGGREAAPMLEGIDTPPKTPVAVTEDTLRGLLYVADRGNRRFILGDRDGAFVRQYRNVGFGDLRGAAVAVDGTRVYVLSGDGIALFEVTPASTAPAANAPAPPAATPSATPAATPAR